MTSTKSFTVEVIADESGTWTGNQVRLPVEEEAEAYAKDLYCRWVQIRQWRVVTSEEPANYRFDRGTLLRIKALGELRQVFGLVKQSDIMRCPYAIMVAAHYRDDGTCRCDDPDHVEMREWGYTWGDGKWQ